MTGESHFYAKGVRISLVAILLIVGLTLLEGIPPWLGAILAALVVMDGFLDWRKLRKRRR